MKAGVTTCLRLVGLIAIGAALGCTNGSGAAVHDAGVAGDGGGSGSDDGSAGRAVVDGASDLVYATGSGGGAVSTDAGSSDAASAPGDAPPAIAATVTLAETAEAFRNPMEGFRPSRYISDAAFRDPAGTRRPTTLHPYSA